MNGEAEGIHAAPDASDGLRVGSLFSGIGGFDLGLERAGHTIVFQCESDPYRRRVLARHWPGVPCFEDVALLPGAWSGYRGGMGGNGANPKQSAGAAGDGVQLDLLAGGFPCQDLSVAGRRAGLQGERSSLFFEFARVADALLPDGGWVLIENVPGLLSSNGGRDFAVLLATLAELGFHDCAWRVLDSRYLGVPQRRRRVFILARRSGGRRASEVLLEPESGGGDFEASGRTGQGSPASFGVGVAGTLGRGGEKGRTGGFQTTDLDNHGAYIASASPHPDRVRAPSGVSGRAHSGRAKVIRTVGDFDDPTIKVDDEPMLAANPMSDRQMMVWREGGEGDRCALDPKPDGPRYAACGDAVTVQVAEWIGRRLAMKGERDGPRDAAA